MNIEISEAKGLSVHEMPTEIVERKGKGHPDFICDKASEELSVELSKFYLNQFGGIAHHNVDKCVLSGGQSNAHFGGGEVLEPIYLLLVGRAVGVVGDDRDKMVPIGKLAVMRTKEWLSEDLPHLDVTSDIIVDYKIRSGSTDLVGNFEEGVKIPRSNDTSIGVGFAPLSETESLTHKTELLLNSSQGKSKFKEAGEDIKVMAVRRNDKIRLTLAIAMISQHIPDSDHYLNIKEEISSFIIDNGLKITDKEIDVDVNTADIPDKNKFYLTVTGTSAEHGDDGQVGRGNRVNGLITPYRPMTLEAAAGKNPVSHVGKTYNCAARNIAKQIIEETDISSVSCYLVSQIGKPITEPQVIELKVHTNGVALSKFTSDIESIVEEEFSQIPQIWRKFLNREYELY